MKKIYIHALTLTSIFLLSSPTLADDDTYCLKNETLAEFYVYSKPTTNLGKVTYPNLGKVDATKHLTGITKDAFPLTISLCSNGPTDKGCTESFENKQIEKPDCYTIYDFGGYSAPHLACDICRAL